MTALRKLLNHWGYLDPCPTLGDQVRVQAGRLGEKPEGESLGGLPVGGIWSGARLERQRGGGSGEETRWRVCVGAGYQVNRVRPWGGEA